MSITPATRVLIIDDDPFYLRMLGEAFSKSGFEVIRAMDGVEGVRCFTEQRPPVVIVDLLMPRMGGVSTCLEIRRLSGEQEPIIILLTSLFHEPPHEHPEPDMGARYHFPKSSKPLDIVILVEQLLERTRPTDSTP